MTMLYPNLCYNKVHYKGTTLYLTFYSVNVIFNHKIQYSETDFIAAELFTSNSGTLSWEI